jgi:hypothetical protein
LFILKNVELPELIVKMELAVLETLAVTDPVAILKTSPCPELLAKAYDAVTA